MKAQKEQVTAEVLNQGGMGERSKVLDELIHSISHDFKAPLRGIHAVSEWLRMDYSSELDDKGVQMLDLLQSRVERLSLMVDSLLVYSRSTRGTNRDDVPLQDVINELVEWFSEESDFVLKPLDGVMPVVHGDRHQLTAILKELISNSIYFNNQERCRIEIQHYRQPAEHVFKIIDNGPGFRADEIESVRKLFYTEIPADNTQKCGIGLALVERILSSNGGRMWLSSDADRGTVAFTWPSA